MFLYHREHSHIYLQTMPETSSPLSKLREELLSFDPFDAKLNEILYDSHRQTIGHGRLWTSGATLEHNAVTEQNFVDNRHHIDM
jgi:hypothetical protein